MTGEDEGRPVAPDDPWVAAKREMYPTASLARVAANARFTVATVSVVGVALTALGLVTVAELRTTALSRILATIAAGLALLAVMSALAYLAERLEPVHYENYVEVRDWYGRQFGRARLVVVASRLLLLAVLTAGTAAITTAWSDAGPARPALSLVVTRVAGACTVTATATVDGLHPGDVIQVRVVDETGRVLITGAAVADSAGSARLQASVDDGSAGHRYRMALTEDGRERGGVEAG